MIRSLDESAFMVNLVRFPKLRKFQERLARKLHNDANELRKIIGDKPKRYKQIKHGKVIEE